MAAPATALPRNSIFICYRRLDSEEMVDRLYEELVEEFSSASLFRDIDSIPPGVDFPTYIAESLQGCPVVLVFIGRDWASCLDEQGQPRLQDPGDHVRIEVETALALPGTRVIPILVRRAHMPGETELPESLRPLRRRNGVTIRSSGNDYQQDVLHLVSVLRRSVSEVLEARRQKVEAEQQRVAAEREKLEVEKQRQEANRREQEPRRTDVQEPEKEKASNKLDTVPTPAVDPVDPKRASDSSQKSRNGAHTKTSLASDIFFVILGLAIILLPIAGVCWGVHSLWGHRTDIIAFFKKPTPTPFPGRPLPFGSNKPLPGLVDLSYPFATFGNKFKLTAITPTLGKLTKTATINGQLYNEGDYLQMAPEDVVFARVRLANISDSSVTLASGQQTYVIHLDLFQNMDPYFGRPDLRSPRTGSQTQHLLEALSSSSPSPTPAVTPAPTPSKDGSHQRRLFTPIKMPKLPF